MTKARKTVYLTFCTLISAAAVAVSVFTSLSEKRGNFVNVRGSDHGPSCVWNHYDAVMPTTSGHGSQEFWACCTHGRSFVLEEPEVANPNQITDCGAFAGADFNNLASDDGRYIPQLEAATAFDAISPVTVSDMGVASGSYAKTGAEGHTFLDYRFSDNGGADVWMKYRYSFADGNYDEAALQLYVLNNHSEDGLRIRLDGRAENDGIAVAYVYSSGQYSNAGTDSDIPSAPAGTAQFFFPRPCQFKSDTDITLHFAITLVDPSTNIFNVKIEAGSGDTLYEISSGPELDTYAPRTFNIEMGAGFSGWVNQSFRFTAKRSADIVLSDAQSVEKSVVYKDADGTVFGKLSNQTSARVPSAAPSGKTLVGWFDANGNKVKNGDSISSKKIVTRRCVDTQTNMFVPSDTLGNEFASAKGGWYASTSFAGECGGRLPVSAVSDRIDLYFIYEFVSKTVDDNYAIFGFPFDFLDAQTRVHFRIQNNSNGLAGYIYGASTNMGDAGASGTYFVDNSFQRSRGIESNFLIHLAVYNASAAGFTFLVEVVDLGNGQVHQATKAVTFNDATLYAINDPARNVFDLMKGNCEYRITDAF